MSDIVDKFVRRYLMAHDRRENAHPGSDEYQSADSEIGRLMDGAAKFGIADQMNRQIAAAFGDEKVTA